MRDRGQDRTGVHTAGQSRATRHPATTLCDLHRGVPCTSACWRRDALRVLRADLRKLKARIDGLGRDSGRDSHDRLGLLMELESAALYTRLALDTAEGR